MGPSGQKDESGRKITGGGRPGRFADPLRQAVMVVAGLNLAYFGIEIPVALAIGGIARYALAWQVVATRYPVCDTTSIARDDGWRDCLYNAAPRPASNDSRAAPPIVAKRPCPSA